MLQPPTDTLYKFQAVFGLVLFLSSIGFAYRLLDRYQQLLLPAQRESEMVAFKEALLEQDFEFLEKSRADLEAEQARTGTQYTKEHPTAQEMKARIDKLGPLTESLCYERAQSALRLREIEKLKGLHYWYYAVCGLGALAGLFLSFGGFRTWARKESRKHAA